MTIQPLRFLRLHHSCCALLSAALLMVLCHSSSWAQEVTATAVQEAPPQQPISMMLEGKIAAKPFVVFYARNVTPKRATDYVTKLSKQLQLGDNVMKQMEDESSSERLKNIEPQVENPVYGTAMYLISGLIPSSESISFQQVTDEADARRLIDGRKSQWGDKGTMEDLGNGCFRVQMKSQYSYALPEGANESQYTNQPMSGNRGYQYTQKVVEKDGKKMVESSQVFTNLFRYQDTVLYEANFEDLFTMELPAADELRSAIEGETEYGFKAYLDRIPQGIRQLGWTMLSSAVGTQLQQQDEESETSYNMRRSAGDAGLALVHAALFDVDNAEASGKFASAEDDSLRAQLRIRARNNSALSGQLTRAAGASRFAPILSDDAAATLHVCVRLPEEASTALQNTAVWLNEEAQKEYASEPTVLAASQSFVNVLNGLAEHRTLELMLKAGWTPGSAGVIYGGLHVSDTPELLQSLHAMLSLAASENGNADHVTLQERDGISVITVQVPQEDVDALRGETGMNITHIFLAHENSCLWIAAGTEKAFDIIKQSVTKCSESSGAILTPLVSGRIDMQKWLSYPQDDPAHIAQLPFWLDENSWAFPPSPFMAMGFVERNMKPSPIMQKVFDYGGAQQAYFALESDEGGLLLSASLGEALANHMVARMINFQESQMQQQQRQIEQQQKEAEAKAKASTGNQDKQ